MRDECCVPLVRQRTQQVKGRDVRAGCSRARQMSHQGLKLRNSEVLYRCVAIYPSTLFRLRALVGGPTARLHFNAHGWLRAAYERNLVRNH